MELVGIDPQEQALLKYLKSSGYQVTSTERELHEFGADRREGCKNWTYAYCLAPRIEGGKPIWVAASTEIDPDVKLSLEDGAELPLYTKIQGNGGVYVSAGAEIDNRVTIRAESILSGDQPGIPSTVYIDPGARLQKGCEIEAINGRCAVGNICVGSQAKVTNSDLSNTDVGPHADITGVKTYTNHRHSPRVSLSGKVTDKTFINGRDTSVSSAGRQLRSFSEAPLPSDRPSSIPAPPPSGVQRIGQEDLGWGNQGREAA